MPRKLTATIAGAGSSAYAISSALCAPLEFVRQQLLDGLLLPPGEAPPFVLHPPSTDQAAAASTDEQFANVVAGPGTGKTSTLIHRIRHLICNKNVRPDEILVLTFTNKAALELVDRLRGAGISDAANIWAGTFHAFGLEFLRKYHQRFDLGPDVNVADKMYSVSAMVDVLPKLPLKHYGRLQDPYDWLGKVMDHISRLKEELVGVDAYRDFILAHRHVDQNIQRRREDTAALYSAYEMELVRRKTVDFVDLIARPAMAMAKDRVPFSEIIDRFRYVLVDEYQDVTRAMVELLRQIALRKSLWVVGDIRQAIHHWRGASLKSLLRFDSELKSHAGSGRIGKYTLDRNRRSRTEILDLVQAVGRSHALESTMPLATMTAERGANGTRPRLVTCADRTDVPRAMELGIRQCHDEGISYGQQVVLCRSAAENREVAAYLRSRGVPTVYIGALVERPEVKTLLCLMQLLVERQPRALIGLTAVQELTMPMSDIQQLMQLANTDLAYQRGRWIHSSSVILSEQGERVRREIRRLVGTSSSRTDAWSFVCNLLLEKRLGLPLETCSSIESWVSRMGLWQFAYSVRNGDGDRREARLSRYLLRLRIRQRIGDDYSERGLPIEAATLDGVQIATVHASKGLEFDAVHVGWVSADKYGTEPAAWQSRDDLCDVIPPSLIGSSVEEFGREQSIERNNLFYVAVSRARERLFLIETGDTTPQLRNCGTLLQKGSFLSRDAPLADAARSSRFQPPDVVNFGRFDSYAICSLQYWYSDVLGLNRDSDLDVAGRAGRAVMSALKLVVARRVEPDVAIAESWAQLKLPSEADDPSLWSDAGYAFQRGLALADAAKLAGGAYAEPIAVVAGQSIQLPWGFATRRAGTIAFQLLRLRRSRASEICTILRPVLAGMGVSGARAEMQIRYVMSDEVDEVKPVSQLEATKGFKVATDLRRGQFGPKRGSHCSRCSYLTICPQAPEA